MTRSRTLRLFVVLLAFTPACAACATSRNVPGVLVLEAQTLPLMRTLTWKAPAVDATHEAADSYTVSLDGVVVGTPTTLTQVITFATLGPHTVSVTAMNVWSTSPPAVLMVNVAPPNSASGLAFK